MIIASIVHTNAATCAVHPRNICDSVIFFMFHIFASKLLKTILDDFVVMIYESSDKAKEVFYLISDIYLGD